MQLLDWSSDSPAENLACDEALLEECENGGAEVLRFWESPSPFVVLGYTGKVAVETKEAECRERGIPILRRCSGGGTVLQGPGCLNYSMVARIAESESLTGITQTNCSVMQAQARAITQVLGGEKIFSVGIRGYTDLVLTNSDGVERKFSGNAQRRRRNCFLFHGTLLLNFDLPLIGQVLREPPVQPEYRQQRAHAEFLVNLHLSADAVKAALAREWSADEALPRVPLHRIEQLVAERVSCREWSRRF